MVNTRDTIIQELQLRLGYGLVDVELDPDHYNLAITKAIEKYRQRSENSAIEAFVPIHLYIDTTDYTMDSDVTEVLRIYRRSIGAGTNSNNFDPFSAQYLNSILSVSGQGSGGLATFDAMAQQREMLGRLFGVELNFTWNNATKNLFIHRQLRAEEDVFVHVYKVRSEETIFNDTYATPWIKDYALAMSKLMLAEGRGKYSTLAGPQGGTQLNAGELRADAQAELAQLEIELKNFAEGSEGYGFIIG